MTQLSSPHYKNEYQGEELPFKYVAQGVELYLHGDSKDVIYKSKFKTSHAELKPVLNDLSEYVHNKSLDYLIKNMAQEFVSEDKYLNLSLAHFKSALRSYGGEKGSLNLVDADKLLCRCSKVDYHQLELNFIQNYGDIVKVKQQTNASMICGSCTSQLKNLSHELTIKHQVFNGKSLAEWRLEVVELLEEFAMYSPPEFEGAKIEIKNFALPLIDCLIHIPHQNLTNELAVKSLTNYLSRELQLPLEIKVSFDIAPAN